MDNKPYGLEAGRLVLENIFNRFERTCNIFGEVLTEKNAILPFEENIFVCYEDYLFFKENFICISGEEDFYFYEQKFLLLVIDELKFNFFNSNVSYSIVNSDNINVVEVSVQLNGREYPILHINPYFKQVIILTDEVISNTYAEIKKYEDLIKELEIEEKKLEISIKNPIFNAENPLQMINATVRKKKKSEEIKFKLADVTNTIMDYQLAIRQLNNSLNDIDIELISATEERDIICRKLTTKLYFNIIDNSYKEEEELSVEETSIESTVHKGLRELNKKIIKENNINL